MKRYDFYGNFDGGGPAISEASDDGDYVLFSDHEAALAGAVAEFEQALAVACMLAEISDSKYESLMIYFRRARSKP
jgi:hypothetical protein